MQYHVACWSKATAVAVACSLSFAAQADKYYTATTTDGTYTYSYRGLGKSLEIGTAAGNAAAITPKPTSGTFKVLTKVGARPVTSIGESAFKDCSGITGVIIPNTVTSIWRYAFANCSGLKELVIPYGVTRLGNYAFQNCTGLKTAYIPILFIDRNLNSAFSGCPSSMEKRFCGIAEVNSTIWHFQTVKTSGGFYTELRNLDDSIAALSIYPGTVEIPSSISGYEVNAIGKNAFLNDTLMTGVSIPDTIVSIEKGAFDGCANLKTVYVSKGDGNRVKSLLEKAGVDVSLLTFEGDSTMEPPGFLLTLKSSNKAYGTVSGGGTYEAGAKVTIKAKKKSGNAFAGWFKNKAYTKALNPAGYDNRKPTVKIEMPEKKLTVYAKFVTKAEAKKSLKFSSSTKKLAKTAKKVEAGKSFSLKLGISSDTLPTVTAKGLPKGLSIDKTTGKITGKPTVPGSFTATVTVKDAAGNKITQKVKITVKVPTWAEGVFNGLVYPDGADQPGSFLQFSVDSTGGITGKVAYRGGTYKFTSAYSSCTKSKAKFAPSLSIGSKVFKVGTITVEQTMSIGDVVITEANNSSRTFVAKKKFALVSASGALSGINGNVYTFTKDYANSGLTKNDDVLRIGLKDDIARIAGTVGGKKLTVTSVPLFLNGAASFDISSTTYELHVNILDYNVKYYKTVVFLVKVDDFDGSVLDVERMFQE